MANFYIRVGDFNDYIPQSRVDLRFRSWNSVDDDDYKYIKIKIHFPNTML